MSADLPVPGPTDVAAARAALAALDGLPAPEVEPEPVPGSLSAWAADPDATLSPLPPLSERLSRVVDGYVERTGWPVGLLPAEALARDLAGLGYTYARGSGYMRDGERAEPDAVARALGDVLRRAAEALPLPPGVALPEHYERLVEESRDVRRRGLDEIPDDVTGGAVSRWLAAADTSGPMRALVLRRRAALTPEERAADARPRRAVSDALMCTASDLATSARARRAALELVRPHLPAPTPADVADGPASRWLATLDGRDRIARADVVREYRAAGSPGGLSAAEIRAAAADRWGAPVTIRGAVTHRPALALAAR